MSPDTQSAVFYHAGPDWATGFGLVDAAAACAAMAQSTRWTEGAGSSPGFAHQRCMLVPSGSGEVRVTLAWDDRPASGLLDETWPRLVNDLDLELVGPDGKTYLPWVLVPPPLSSVPSSGGPDPIAASDIAPADRGVDRRNNVEVVSVAAPPGGVWSIVVRAASIPLGDVQRYSLVTSHDVLGFCMRFELRETPICSLYPWLCEDRDWVRPAFDPIEHVWRLPARSVLALEEVCKQVRCPAWRGPAWAEQHGIAISVGPVPDGARLALFDQDGRVLAHSPSGGEQREVRVEAVSPDARYFLAIANSSYQPFEDVLSLNVSVRAVD